MQKNSSDAVPDGLVLADRAGEWIHVRIGRARYVKRFNLSDAEARQLTALLIALVGENQAVLLKGGGAKLHPLPPSRSRSKPAPRQTRKTGEFTTARKNPGTGEKPLTEPQPVPVSH